MIEKMRKTFFDCFGFILRSALNPLGGVVVIFFMLLFFWYLTVKK